MARIEDTFTISAAGSAHSAAPQANTGEALPVVVTMDDPMSAASDATHERAIVAAGLEVEACIRKRQDALDVWVATGCLAARGEADRWLLEAQAAAELQGALIAARSPERVAQMLAEQAARMALEPGAERT